MPHCNVMLRHCVLFLRMCATVSVIISRSIRGAGKSSVSVLVGREALVRRSYDGAAAASNASAAAAAATYIFIIMGTEFCCCSSALAFARLKTGKLASIMSA